MSKNLSFLLIAMVLFGISHSCYAGSKNKLRDNIVYRVNLGRPDDVALLLKQGASVDEVNESGAPLISLAAIRSDVEGLTIIKLLVGAGADINKADKRGQTALFYAAKAGNKETVKYLLEQKINYSTTDNSGNNARVVAYQTGHSDIIEILDNFVREQNELNRKRYEEINKTLDEYNKNIQKQVNQNTNGTSANITNNTKNAVNTAAKPVDPNSQSAKVKDLVYKTSFAACSNAYWKFCNLYSQPTEFAGNVIGIAETQVKQAKKMAGELINDYHIDINIIKNMMADSATKINNQLNALVSNEARKEAGVGSMEDMSRRCVVIASAWNNLVDENIASKLKKSDSTEFDFGQSFPQSPIIPKP